MYLLYTIFLLILCENNEQIIKDKSAIRYINKWDIAIFRGGENGILHRTPNSALDGSSYEYVKKMLKSGIKSQSANKSYLRV